ncbi:MAG: PadR family transcriptional regulator [Oscillospiraceae bacterium]|jgi:PadR family transcriptional regulator PadR|nr:PadR family transcriptional regulator [Oscillospiraceae bacterium]
MDAQLKRGLLDACLLAILTRGESYGYKISQSAERFMPVSESTLYPVLRRMEQQGYLETRQQEHNGRLRKYYRITPGGEDRLRVFRTEWGEIKRMVDYVMGEDRNDDAQ